ncbi:unnamed protein product [Urochloa humidicola]
MEGAAQNKPLLMKQKAETMLRMWWQRSRDSVKNVTEDTTVVATAISFLASFCIFRTNAFLESPLPMSFAMIPGFRGIYFSSLRTRRSQAFYEDEG